MSGVLDRSVPKDWIPEIARKFATMFKNDKEWWQNYFFTAQDSTANQMIGELKLNDKQMLKMKEFVHVALRDVYYHILRGLDGAGNIGGVQQIYEIYDENEKLISDCGDLEAAAYEVFYGDEDNA